MCLNAHNVKVIGATKDTIIDTISEKLIFESIIL